RRWSTAAERMTRGLPAMGQRAFASQPPPDSGETSGLLPGRLTVTFGLGPRRSGGDLLIQACADDPTIAFHAVRMLHELAYGAAVLRWTQRGFLPAAYRREQTPRNLMGMKDGTLNPPPGGAAFEQNIWVSGA